METKLLELIWISSWSLRWWAFVFFLRSSVSRKQHWREGTAGIHVATRRSDWTGFITWVFLRNLSSLVYLLHCVFPLKMVGMEHVTETGWLGFALIHIDILIPFRTCQIVVLPWSEGKQYIDRFKCRCPVQSLGLLKKNHSTDLKIQKVTAARDLTPFVLATKGLSHAESYGKDSFFIVFLNLRSLHSAHQWFSTVLNSSFVKIASSMISKHQHLKRIDFVAW